MKRLLAVICALSMTSCAGGSGLVVLAGDRVTRQVRGGACVEPTDTGVRVVPWAEREGDFVVPPPLYRDMATAYLRARRAE